VHARDNAEACWSRVPFLRAKPLNSVIVSNRVENATLYVQGYAVGGANGQVGCTYVTTDEDHMWHPARMPYQGSRRSWTPWE
ncbi:hypothetical protein PHLGIDRAFT_51843, partial [Phlebiopsis gigantea 11061_1 CR5-6]